MTLKTRHRWFTFCAALSFLLAMRLTVLWVKAQYRLSWVGYLGEQRWALAIARPDALYLALGSYDRSVPASAPPPTRGYPSADRKAFLVNSPGWRSLPRARLVPRVDSVLLSCRTPASASYLALPYWLLIVGGLALPATWLASRPRSRTSHA